MNADHKKTTSILSYLRSSASICGLILVVSGCCTQKGVEPYYGPTLTMSQMAAAVNANNELIPTLNANLDYNVEVTHDGKKDSVSGYGVLNFRRPGDLRISGSKDFVGAVFDIGSNDKLYWMTLIPQVETAWYGQYKNLGKPCVANLPIQPDMLVEVLGISTFNTNFTEQPVPVMRIIPEERAYEFTWNIRLADRWATKKQVMYDVDSKQPTRVTLYDEHGRTMLRADLKSPVVIEVPELPKDRWPKVASKYDLIFPESQMRLQLELFDIVLKKGRVPNNATFKMPDLDKLGVKKENVIEVDKDCND